MTKKKLTVRPANIEDTKLVFSFIQALAEYEGRPEDVYLTEGQLEAILFRRCAAKVIIAEIDSRPAGFALYYPVVSTFSGRINLYIEDLFVYPDDRRKGVGRALIDTLCRMPEADGLKWLCLADNLEGQAFYKKLGARKGLMSVPYVMDGVPS